MNELKALRLRIYQPHAHYRVPFTYQRRHTYPIPPYSTIIGLLCNVLGIRNLKMDGEPDDTDYKKLKNLKISIAGTFQSKTTEYTWFRNLSKDSHITRFGSTNIREINGHIEHIGGQSPVSIDILNEVNLFIYLAHNDEAFLTEVKTSLENPTKRLYPLHLGRAEDWIVFKEEPTIVELQEKPPDGNYRHFFWIPGHYVRNGQTPGLRYRVPKIYELKNGIRNFISHEDAFLNDGKIIGLKGYFDKDDREKIRMPVFFSQRLDYGAINRILAKSIKRHKETGGQEKGEIYLDEHTKDVYDAFENLSKRLPNNQIDQKLKQAIQIAIICHDFGKVLPAFQQRTLGNKDYKPFHPYNNVPHSLFSVFWMDEERIRKQLKNENFKQEELENLIKFIYSSVAFHHWRGNFDQIINWSDSDLCEILNKLILNEKADCGKGFRDVLHDNLKVEFQDFLKEHDVTTYIRFNKEWADGIVDGITLSEYVTAPYLNTLLPQRAECLSPLIDWTEISIQNTNNRGLRDEEKEMDS